MPLCRITKPVSPVALWGAHKPCIPGEEQYQGRPLRIVELSRAFQDNLAFCMCHLGLQCVKYGQSVFPLKTI